MNFGADGGLSGNASCNSFSTTYTADEGVLTIDTQIAMTLMACDPATDDQERAVLSFLNAVASDGATISIDGDALTITSSGSTIEAAR